MSRQEDAANRVEDLLAPAKELVIRLRKGDLPDRDAYALLYELRYRMGQAVAELGAGVPPKSYRRLVKEFFDQGET